MVRAAAELLPLPAAAAHEPPPRRAVLAEVAGVPAVRDRRARPLVRRRRACAQQGQAGQFLGTTRISAQTSCVLPFSQVLTHSSVLSCSLLKNGREEAWEREGLQFFFLHL